MISIIIPFNKGKNYLKECLESIAEQKYKEIETILVKDETNGDKSENISDIVSKYQEQINPKIITMTDESGVSVARNKGVIAAGGEYVYFLDSDDYVLENTLTSLIEHIKEGSDLVYGHISNSWYKKAAYEIEENPEITEINDYKLRAYGRIEEMTTLGTLYRKEFLVDNHIWFDKEQKYYPDAEFWTRVLLKVSNYSCAKESTYVKRYRNDSVNNPALSQIKDNDRERLKVKAYLNCIRLSKDNEEIKNHIEKMLCDYHINEFCIKLFEKNIEAKKIMVECFKEANDANLKKHKNKYIKYYKEGNLKKADRLSYLMAVKNKIALMFSDKKHLYRTINLAVFRRMKQKDNWIVFESFIGRNCSGQPKYIYEYLQKNYGGRFKYIWVLNDKKTKIDGKCKKVKRLGLKYYYYMTRSKYWINNARQPIDYPKRASQVMLETWHGTPLKKLFFDMDDVHSEDPNYKANVYKQSRQWDYLLSDNPFSTEKFQSCFMFDKEKILEFGYPANDPLYDKSIEEKAQVLKEKLCIPKNKKVLLYAPTWRDDNAYGDGEYKYESALDFLRLKQEIGNEYVLLLRTHYWVVDRMELNGLSDFVINVSDYDDITDLYLVSDICMTDYSSVFFDYANLKRPILFFMYDLEKYRDVLRGFYLDIEKDLPGPILKTNDEVLEAIKNIDSVNKDYGTKYEKFYNRFCSIDDGNAAKRVCEKVFDL